jgi:hypothetical protein
MKQMWTVGFCRSHLFITDASVPADRFSSCYGIAHWAMPPVRTLSLMASETFHTVLDHFSFVHSPTFRIVDTAACLAFAICTVGGVRTNPTPDPLMQHKGSADSPTSLGEVAIPDSWEHLFENNWHNKQGQDEEDTMRRKQVDEWTAGPLVRQEKTNMLVKVGTPVYVANDSRSPWHKVS